MNFACTYVQWQAVDAAVAVANPGPPRGRGGIEVS